MSARGHDYQCKLVNGLAGDPAIYVFSRSTGDAHLFDMGSLEQMTHKDLLRVKCVMVSHTHIDHFIGFDRWLRVNVPHHRELTIIGPENMAGNVSGKINGYSWNLISPDQISFIVWEVLAEGKTRAYKVASANQFKPTLLEDQQKPTTSDGALSVCELSDGSHVHAIPLDHGIPSLAYTIKTPLYFDVDTALLTELGLQRGPWLGELQRDAKQGALKGQVVVSDSSYDAIDLAAKVLIARDVKPLGYVTDIIFSHENLRRARSLLTGVVCLYCESHFASEDFQRAFDKKHLTTKQAALLASYVGAETLVPFHISNLYHGHEQDVVDEALSFFQQFRSLSVDAIEKLVEEEMAKRVL